MKCCLDQKEYNQAFWWKASVLSLDYRVPWNGLEYCAGSIEGPSFHCFVISVLRDSFAVRCIDLLLLCSTSLLCSQISQSISQILHCAFDNHNSADLVDFILHRFVCWHSQKWTDQNPSKNLSSKTVLWPKCLVEKYSISVEVVFHISIHVSCHKCILTCLAETH